MRRHIAYGIVVASLLAAWANAGRALAADDKVPGDRLLPSDVYFFAEVPSVPELKARWQKSLMGRITADPALGEFRQDIEAHLAKISSEIEKQAGVSLGDLVSIPSGQLTLAVLKVSSGKIGVVAIVDYGENSATVDKLLATASKSMTENGAKRTEEDVDGTTVTIYAMPDAEKTDPNQKQDQDASGAPAGLERALIKTQVFFNRDQRFVFASDLEIAKSVLARWDGKHSSTFAGNEAHQYILKRCTAGNEQPAIAWYVEPLGLVSAAIEMSGDAELEMMQLLGLAENMGLKQLKAAGGTVDFSVDKYDSISKSMVYIDGEPRGILKLFRMPEAELSPPKWVPAGVVSYMTYNWEIAGAYAAAESLYDGFRGPGEFATLVDQLSTQPGGTQVHLKRDFLDHLTGRVHIVNLPPKEEAKKPASENAQEEELVQLPPNRTLLVFDGKNPDKLQALLKTLAESPDFKGKSREFQGVTLYELPASVGWGSSSGAAVVSNSLMVTTDVNLIEQVVRSDKEETPLIESSDYRRLAEQFPSKTSLLGFQRQSIEQVYELLRAGNLPGGVSIEGLHAEKLPPFAEIKKYIPETGVYAIPDERGALYVTFTLPEKGK